MSKNSSSKYQIFKESYLRKYILNNYNLEDADITLIKIKDTDKQRAVFKISKNGLSYCLKKIYFNEENLLFVYSALQWLWKKGVRTPILLNTKDGLKYVKHNGVIFILTHWINGYKCDYDNKDHIILSIRQLAHTHSCSRNFTPIRGSEDRLGLDNYYISTSKHFTTLLLNYNKANSINDKFSKLFLDNFDENLELAKITLDIASNINEKELSKSLCHGDYVNKNILFDNNDHIWAIDLDKCKFDYSMRDLSYYLRRLLRRSDTLYNVELTLLILREYNYYAKLTPSDLRYLVASVCFPHKFWKLSKDYYKNINKCNKNAFISLLNKTNDRIYFHTKFINEIIPRIEKEYSVKL